MSCSPNISCKSFSRFSLSHSASIKNPFLISNKNNSNNDREIGIDTYAKNSNVKEWLYEQSAFISVNTWGEKLVNCFIENINDKFPMPDIDDFIDHLDYVVDLIGIDYVGISSDFGGGGGISGWMDASETKLLTLKLKERGYSPKEIEKIWGGNILRVWRKVENIASKT